MKTLREEQESKMRLTIEIGSMGQKLAEAQNELCQKDVELQSTTDQLLEEYYIFYLRRFSGPVFFRVMFLH